MFFLTNKKKYIYFGVVFLLIFFHYLGWLSWLENASRSVITPISSFAFNLQKSTSKRYQYFKDRNQSVELYEQCKEDLKEITAKEVEIKKLSEENENLKKLANFKTNSNYQLVSANIIGKNTNSIEKMYLLDIGSLQGVKEGQAVIVKDGVFIGKIAEVEKEFSFVRLLNDNQSKVAATIINQNKSLGVVEGGYGLSVRMNLIPRDEIVIVGEQVITSGLDNHIPRGLLIGEIAGLENEAYRPFQQAILTPAINLEKISIVGVLVL